MLGETRVGRVQDAACQQRITHCNARKTIDNCIANWRHFVSGHNMLRIWMIAVEECLSDNLYLMEFETGNL